MGISIKKILAYLQWLLPQHFISWAMGQLAESRRPWLKQLLIDTFIKHYQISLEEAVIKDPKAYPTFNQFFVRQLRPGTRPIAAGQIDIASPVDGSIAQIGQIDRDQLLQAK